MEKKIEKKKKSKKSKKSKKWEKKTKKIIKKKNIEHESESEYDAIVGYESRMWANIRLAVSNANIFFATGFEHC